MPIMASVKKPRTFTAQDGTEINVYVPHDISPENLQKVLEMEYNRKKEGSKHQQDYSPTYEKDAPSKVIMPFQYPEGDQTPLPQKALGYGLDAANVAGLALAPELAATNLPALLTGLATGAVGNTAASMAGASPEVAGLAGAAAGGLASSMPKIQAGISGAYTGLKSALLENTKGPYYREVPALLLARALGLKWGTAEKAAAAVGYLPPMVRGAKAAMSQEPWFANPFVNRSLQQDSKVINAEWANDWAVPGGRTRDVPPEFGAKPYIQTPKLLTERMPVPYSEAYPMPPAQVDPLTALPPAPAYPQIEAGQAPKMLMPPSQFNMGPISTRSPISRQLPAPSYTIDIGPTLEYTSPITNTIPEATAKAAAKKPGPETPAHGVPGQTSDPPAVPSTDKTVGRVNTDKVVTETKKTELPKPDAVSLYTGSENPQFMYNDAKTVAAKLDITASSVMEWLEKNGYNVEPSKMNKAGSWQRKNPASKNILDAIGLEGILKQLEP